MSKKFKTQDHFRYKKLGKRWRRPVGLQSKLRIRRSGSGRKVSIGYGSQKEGELDQVVTVRNVNDVVRASGKPIRIAATVGAKNTIEIAKKAKELDSRVVNAKKVKRAQKLAKEIEKKQRAKRKEEKKKEEKEVKEEGKEEKKEPSKDVTQEEKPDVGV